VGFFRSCFVCAVLFPGTRSLYFVPSSRAYPLEHQARGSLGPRPRRDLKIRPGLDGRIRAGSGRTALEFLPGKSYGGPLLP